MTATVVVDARGQRCPLPVIALARRARELEPGSVLTLLATDPAARQDVAAWARLRGHELVGAQPDDASETGQSSTWRLTVRLGTSPS